MGRASPARSSSPSSASAPFDEDDVRLLEVLGGHASVALENARLYEAERLEAKRARASLEISNALLDFSRRLALAESLDEVLQRAGRAGRPAPGEAALVSLVAGSRRRGSRRPRAPRLQTA